MDRLPAYQETWSHYPDPEQSGLALPWLDQYQPVPVEQISSTTRPIVQASSTPWQNESIPGESYEALTSTGETSVLLPEGGLHDRSAVLEGLEEGPDFEASGMDATSDQSMSEHETELSPSKIAERYARDDDAVESKASRRRGRRRGRRPRVGDEAGPGRWGRPRRGEARTRGRPSRGVQSRGRGGRGLKRGPRPAMEPSKEFTALQKEALDAFIDRHDHDEALNLIQQAISLNPEVYAAHALMSEVYFARGDLERGVAALFSGAHAAPRDAQVWRQVADACLQKLSSDRDKALQQAAYCFSRIISMDRHDLDSRFQRAAINQELGHLTSALREFEKILVVMPHNPSVLQQIAEVCLELGEIDKAKELYRDCISYHRDRGLAGEEAFFWSDVSVYIEIFGRIEEYEEGIASLKSLSRWLLGRNGEDYWDHIVEDDREWDLTDEPRRISVPQFVPGEYPSQSYGFGLPLELRVKLGILRLNLGPRHLSEALNHFEWLEPEDLTPGAKVFGYAHLFRDVGHALKDIQEDEKALRFFRPLKATNAFADVDFWLAVAASSYVCAHVEQARECYEAAKASDATCAEACTQLAKIYRNRGSRDKALENAHEALEIGRRAVIRPYKRRYERREAREAREAAEGYLKETHKLAIPSMASMVPSAKPIEVKDGLGRRAEISGNTYLDRQWKYGYRMAQQRKMKQASSEERETQRTSNIQSLYTRMEEMTPAMRSGDLVARLQWLECADELIHDFRSVRVFYPAERHIRFEGFDADARRRAFRKRWVKGHDEGCEAVYKSTANADASMTQDDSSIPTEYRGIAFDAWLDIFLEQAFILARLGEEFRRDSYETITAALDCTIWYHQPEAMLKIHVCYLTCALALHDGETLSNVVARWFMREYQFATDSYRLFAALNLLYSGSSNNRETEAKVKDLPFRHSCKKFLFRQIRAMDPNLADDVDDDGSDGLLPETVKTVATPKNRDVNTNLKPKDVDVVLLSLYAGVMYACGSFLNALHYLYRAYALDPRNPMLLLHMALCYVHENFKRQNENKHLYVMQGLAYFQQYADARMAQAEEKGPQVILQAKTEIEFNQARIWNMLNLTNLAIDGYKRVLAISDEAQPALHSASPNGGAGMIRESAYALQTAYALSGNMKMAQRIAERWLVI